MTPQPQPVGEPDLTQEVQMADPSLVSIIVPFLNERDTLVTLSEQIAATFAEIGRPFEILYVDDGSTDDGPEIVKQLTSEDPRVRLVQFTRNFGKAAALSAGIAQARGEVIMTMDADLQDDPAEIPRFLETLEDGHDYVSGWKQKRHDPASKTLPSRIFNRMTSRMFDIEIHDINCGFKAYSRRAARHLNLYGEMHRFTPAILHAAGFEGTEIIVNHNPREHGVSKYGTTRMVKGFLDMFTVKMMTTYSGRPLHFFAMIGLPLFFLGGAFIAYLSVLWLLDLGPIGDRPLLLIGILLVVTGTQIVSVGFVAELMRASSIGEREKYVIDSVTEDGATRLV